MYKLILSLIIFSSFATSSSLAAQSRNAPEGDATVVIYSVREQIQDPIYSSIQTQIEVAATQQAQIWGDTILEGDFIADGKTHVDEVTAVFKNNLLQGYKFTYSEKAWLVIDCEYNVENLEGPNTCLSGRIVEGSYTSSDFSSLETDEEHYAQFFQDKK